MRWRSAARRWVGVGGGSELPDLGGGVEAAAAAASSRGGGGNGCWQQ